MNYLKKPVGTHDLDVVRINQSANEDKLSPEPMCDWCGDPKPVVLYASRRMANGVFKVCWRWMACAVCEALVDNDDWVTIRQRTTARFKKFFAHRLPQGVPDDLVKEAVNAALNQFPKYAIVGDGNPQ